MECALIAGKEIKMKKKITNDDEEIVEEEDWCRKCGKIVDLLTLAEFDGMCPVCWHERNG